MLSRTDERPHYPPPRSLSTVMAELAAMDAASITVGEIELAFADRTFAALVTFFGAINCLPLPPGSSFVLGIPLIILSAQMIYGAKAPWLPRFVRERTVSRETFLSAEKRISPWLARFERIVRPRWWPFDRKAGERTTGAAVLFLAILLTLPMPFGNWPPAFAIALFGISLSERDGVVFGLASALAVVATVIFFVVAFSLKFALQWLIA